MPVEDVGKMFKGEVERRRMGNWQDRKRREGKEAGSNEMIVVTDWMYICIHICIGYDRELNFSCERVIRSCLLSQMMD